MIPLLLRSSTDPVVDAPTERRIVQLCGFVVLLGLAWRIARYLLDFPIWGDEALLIVQFLERPHFADFLRPLDNAQVAPLGFLWLLRLFADLFGTSEFALRLAPLIVGIATLAAAWWAFRLIAGPLAGSIAAALLACSKFPGRYATEIKPYGLDLLVACLLLGLAAKIAEHPTRRKPWALLIVLTPLLLAFSYPAVFVAGGVALALGLIATTTRQRPALIATALFGLTLLASFCALYALTGTGQYKETYGTMMSFWDPAFVPRNASAFLWVLKVHTGTLMAYPAGGSGTGSLLTFALFAAGVIAVIARRRWFLLTLLLTPFLLNLIAAALRRYPYGIEPRIVQHLAPAICILTAIGLVEVTRRLARTPRTRLVILGAAPVIFAAFTIAYLVHDGMHPVFNTDDAMIRDVLQQAETDAATLPGGRLFIVGTEPATPMWYLNRDPAHIRKLPHLPANSPPELLVISFWPPENVIPDGYTATLDQPMQLHIWKKGDTWMRLVHLKRIQP